MSVTQSKLGHKVAIITGAGRGIGRGIATAFAREGARLVLVSRTAAQIEQAAQEARGAGADAMAVPADITVPLDVRRIVDLAIERYSRVDVLVNNAGLLGPLGPFADNDMEHWAETMRVNVIGLAACCSAVLPGMIRQGGGKIINLSGAGVARPSQTLSAYGTSKAAVIRFTETLALEVRRHHIWVNALGPGQIDTELLEPVIHAEDGAVDADFSANVRRTKSGHGASLDNAAALAVWLASSESDGLTGRMISATQDDWRALGPRIPEIMDSDRHTLRFVT